MLLFPTVFFSQNKAVEESLQKLAEHQKEDSEKADLMLKLAVSYYGVETKKMTETAKDAYNLSKKLNYKKGMAESIKLQGAASIALGNFKDAENYFNESLKIFQSINNQTGISICYSNLGSVKLMQNQYPEALRLYQTSIRYAEKSGDFKNTALAYGNMGIIYSEMKNYDMALDHFNKALQNHIKSKNANGIASSYSNMGTVYLKKEDLANAHQYYQLALEKNTEIGNQLGISREYGNIASLFMKENNYAKAFENINAALKINKEFKNKKGIALNYQGLGEFYLHEKKPEESLNYLSKALKIASEIGTKDIEQETYKSLSELHSQNKNADSAYYYYKKYIDIKETVDNENNRKQISRLEIQYEFDAKEERYKNKQILDGEHLKQNELLLDLNNLKLSESNKERDLAHLDFLKTQTELENEQLASGVQKKQLEISKKEIQIKKNEIKAKQNEIKLNKLELSVKEKQKWFYIIGLGFLSIIGGLLFYQSWMRKKNNKKLIKLNSELDSANKTKARFLAMLNHDLRSPVSRLIHFLNLQKDSPELLDEPTKERLNNQAKTSAEHLLEQMENLLLWSKSQMEKFEPHKIKFEAKELFGELKNEFSSVDEVEFLYDFPSEQKIFSDKEFLKTILRNLINNAVKALQNRKDAKISIISSETETSTTISVKDNGGGANPEIFKVLFSNQESIVSKNGLGLHLIRDMAKAIEAEISVNSEIEKGGTEITIRVKKV